MTVELPAVQKSHLPDRNVVGTRAPVARPLRYQAARVL